MLSSNVMANFSKLPDQCDPNGIVEKRYNVIKKFGR